MVALYGWKASLEKEVSFILQCIPAHPEALNGDLPSSFTAHLQILNQIHV